MWRSRFLLRGLGLLAFLLCSSTGRAALPYRFLLVISDQWKDPASYVIEAGGEFPVIVSLLKSWGLPFDILRLDQERFDRYYLLDREGQPRYGTIIWDAGPGELKEKGVELLGALVRDQGVNLVAVGDTVAVREVGRLAGLEYVSEYALATDLAVAREHFISRDLKGREEEFLPGGGRQRGDKVMVRGATVVVRRGTLPFLTIREYDKGGRVAWIDAHRPSAQLARQIVRDLFKRCLVWAQGYALYHEYAKSIILEMHDAGASDKTFLPYWHYPNLTEEQIRDRIITPLKRHQAVLAQVVNTGYVDRKTERILNPWKQERVLDELDGKTIHDYASLKRGLDAGLREGVFEIQSHGWTHMLPDLDSPPGPFWKAPLDGVATLGWDNEFGDRIRDREIPAATQKMHMERSIECLREDFGVTPLFIRPGGGEFSQTYANHTGRIAAQLGFGLARLSSPFYLGRDLVVALGPVIAQSTWAYDRKLSAADIPWTVDGPFFLAFHDRDVAMDAGAVERLLGSLGDDVRYMSPDEYCGYLHAEVERAPAAGNGLALTVRYRQPYGRFFASHSSVWTLHLADETRRWLKESLPEKQTIEIPPGLGPHTLRAGEGMAGRRPATPRL